MFAVIRTGGKQYRVAAEGVIVVEKLIGEAGTSVELTEVLAMGKNGSTTIGTPLVEGARVAATVLDQGRQPTVLVFKKKRRKNHRRMRGHRQQMTVLKIDQILGPGEKAAPRKAAARKSTVKTAEGPGDEVKPVAKKPAAKKAAAAKSEGKPAAAKKSAAKRSTVDKTTEPKKPAAKKASAAKKTTAAKKPAAKKSAVKKPAAKTSKEQD